MALEQCCQLTKFKLRTVCLTTKFQSKADEEIRLAGKLLLERLDDLRLKCNNWT